MSAPGKRKERNGDADDGSRAPKKSKGGTGGKWKTPHQMSKADSSKRGQIEVGDVGIWVTCAKNQESRASAELIGMLEECADRFYGLKTGADKVDNDDDDAEDIEASIKRELSGQKITPKIFSVIRLDIPCVLFVKVQSSLDPVDFVHKICQEVVSNPKIRKMRYINRLTPTTLIGRASEKGLEEVSTLVLAQHFKLKEPDLETSAQISGERNETGVRSSYAKYAIRPTIRAHNTLTRDVVIQQIASSISEEHKVDLTTPDQVIIVEIYTAICGMSVVGNDWESLKRYNLSELYKLASSTAKDAGPRPKPATRDEAAPKDPKGNATVRTDGVDPSVS